MNKYKITTSEFESLKTYGNFAFVFYDDLYDLCGRIWTDDLFDYMFGKSSPDTDALDFAMNPEEYMEQNYSRNISEFSIKDESGKEIKKTYLYDLNYNLDKVLAEVREKTKQGLATPGESVPGGVTEEDCKHLAKMYLRCSKNYVDNKKNEIVAHIFNPKTAKDETYVYGDYNELICDFADDIQALVVSGSLKLSPVDKQTLNWALYVNAEESEVKLAEKQLNSTIGVDKLNQLKDSLGAPDSKVCVKEDKVAPNR